VMGVSVAHSDSGRDGRDGHKQSLLEFHHGFPRNRVRSLNAVVRVGYLAEIARNRSSPG
jgi:hypothetical protein